MTAAPAAPSAHGPEPGAKACTELTRAGSIEAAITCYDVLAEGTGVGAELALFERARLEGKALRSPTRALDTLREYHERFPFGSLRAEVTLAEIDWAVELGNTALALKLIEAALQSGLAVERRGELERLKARLSAAK